MNAEFIAMLDYLERERGIKREILIEAVSNALLSASKKSVWPLLRKKASRNWKFILASARSFTENPPSQP